MLRAIGALVIVLGTIGATGTAQPSAAPPIDLFFDAAHVDDRVARKALEQIGAQWKDSYTPLIIDLARQLRRAPRVTDSALPSASFSDDDPSGGGGDARGAADVGGRPIPREDGALTGHRPQARLPRRRGLPRLLLERRFVFPRVQSRQAPQEQKRSVSRSDDMRN